MRDHHFFSHFICILKKCVYICTGYLENIEMNTNKKTGNTLLGLVEGYLTSINMPFLFNCKNTLTVGGVNHYI